MTPTLLMVTGAYIFFFFSIESSIYEDPSAKDPLLLINSLDSPSAVDYFLWIEASLIFLWLFKESTVSFAEDIALLISNNPLSNEASLLGLFNFKGEFSLEIVNSWLY